VLKIEELDLSFNNLTFLKKTFFTSLSRLRRVNLRNTNLINFDFLKLFKLVEELDLTNNDHLGQDPNFSFSYFGPLPIKRLELPNTQLVSVPTSRMGDKIPTIQYLNLKGNAMYTFDEVFLEIEYLDLSENEFNYMLNLEPQILKFYEFCTKMIFINLTKSITKELANKIFYFNVVLEFAFMSKNELISFPKFCQYCTGRECAASQTNFECHLKILDFNSNRIERILYTDLMDLTNLEYLNLENNLISYIDANAFSNLGNLETLLLSNNNISSSNVFNSLTSLKYLSLKGNRIEIVPSYFFKNLFKLETVDLSSNRIRELEKYSFFNLLYLRNLNLEKNENEIKIDSEAFSQLKSIQTIYMSKDILDEESNRAVFIDLFDYQKKTVQMNVEKKKQVLGRSYFKSLFLMFDYGSFYDCNLTLYFMRHNLHLNFKLESQIHDYFEACSLERIKYVISINDNEKKIKYLNVFSNVLLWFFYLTLLFILILSFALVI